MNKLFYFFRLSRAEQNGFFVLLVLIGLVTFSPIVWNLIHTSPSVSYQLHIFEDDKTVLSYTEIDKQESSYPGSTYYSSKATPLNEVTYFDFDPNQLTAEGWKKLGFKAYQIRMILNYTAKGGKFYKKEDLRKIYAIKESDYQRIEAYIRIPRTPSADHNVTTETSAPYPKTYQNTLKTAVIDINTADTAAWMLLKGIGPSFARRIVRFRDALGGFYAIQQIKEVYGMDAERYKTIESSLQVVSTDIRQLELNTLTAAELARHPYISYKQATAIANYRKEHGNYKNINDLKAVLLLDEEFLRKLEPYLKF
ncbi:comEA protein [Sphingobacterium spiritivorum]|uniref:ComEA protein n=1 Tax=Sphingobacterium spiritivorum TaxID=258 RepID=A0A380CR98_SPHSI|nr:helix-hairpin-helix domain-containing protein [Sphingobacterium spiritivorum]SUJ27066.1 comEA protein [Sphingobacterium spiritivorum]